MLCLGGETEAIHEPFNPDLYHTWLSQPVSRWFQYVDPDCEPPFAGDVARVLAFRPSLPAMLRRSSGGRAVVGVAREGLKACRGRMMARRPLLKDPIAFFAAEWFAASFDANIVVLVRHPAAFASSLKRLDWTFDFTNLAAQPQLVERHLWPYRHELEEASRGHLDVIDQASLLWRVINHTALTYRREHPDWSILRYEDVAADPVAAYRSLYEVLGLTWSDRAERGIARYTSTSNTADVPDGDRGGVRRDSRRAIWTWTSRLTDAEIARVRMATADVADEFYDADSWRPPAM